MKKYTAILILTLILAMVMAGCAGGTTKETAEVPKTVLTEPPTEPVKTFTVHAYLPENWGNASVWAWSAAEGDLSDAWPGESMQSQGEGWYTYDVPEWVDHVVITGLGGSLKSEDIPIESKEVWIEVKNDGSSRVEYAAFEIPQDGYIAVLVGSKGTYTDGYGGRYTAILCEEPVKDCYQLTVNMDVTMKSGARCKEWRLVGFADLDDLHEETLGEIYLPDGDGKVEQTFTFEKPVTFEALCVMPKILGSYSWSMTTEYTDIWTLPQE